MLRAVIIAGSILTLLGAIIFGQRLLIKESFSGADTAPKQECDLLAGPCEWADSSGNWRVELSVPSGNDQYFLKVTTTKAHERFLAVLRGESMYMGEYPVPLLAAKDSSNTYVARFDSPVCTTASDMVWRIDLQQGQKVIEQIPVKMVFQVKH